MRSGRLVLTMILAGQLLLPGRGETMNTNYNRPYGTHIGWGTTGSLPTMIFSSPQSDELIFDDEKEIVIRCHVGLRSVSMTWTLARNQFRKTFLEGTGEPLLDNSFIIRIDSASLKPGLYDLRVKVDTGDRKSVEGRSTFGYRVADMQVADYRPDDFAEFWRKARLEVDAVPLDPQMGPEITFSGRQIEDYNLNQAFLPASYDPEGVVSDTVHVRQVSFGAARGRRLSGWLARPQGKGPFPAMLILPGGGSDTRPMPLEHARHGFIALDVAAYGDLPAGQQFEAADDRESSAMHLRYLDALQAVNCIASLPDVDKERIVVVGQSWGGRLTMMVAALDSRIAAIVPGITHYSYNSYNAWARSGQSDGMEPGALPSPPSGDARRNSYYDILYFAPDISCPAFMTVGLIDDVSPATGVLAAFNRLGIVEKKILPLPGIGHFWTAEADRRAWRWLEKIISR